MRYPSKYKKDIALSVELVKTRVNESDLQRFEEEARLSSWEKNSNINNRNSVTELGGKSRGFLAMKVPKTTNRLCPYCKKKTPQKIKLVGTGFQRGTLTRGSIARARFRGKGRGIGNKGKWGSKPAVSKFKRKSKTTKKTNIMYTCSVCGKSKYRAGRRNKRAGKVLQE